MLPTVPQTGVASPLDRVFEWLLSASASGLLQRPLVVGDERNEWGKGDGPGATAVRRERRPGVRTETVTAIQLQVRG